MFYTSYIFAFRCKIFETFIAILSKWKLSKNSIWINRSMLIKTLSFSIQWLIFLKISKYIVKLSAKLFIHQNINFCNKLCHNIATNSCVFRIFTSWFLYTIFTKNLWFELFVSIKMTSFNDAIKILIANIIWFIYFR